MGQGKQTVSKNIKKKSKAQKNYCDKVMYQPFDSHQQRHDHALQFLNLLYEFDDFMMSIDKVVDIGAGTGLDTEWWATRTSRDEEDPQPLNIRVMAVSDTLNKSKQFQHENVIWHQGLSEDTGLPPNAYDLIWCHDQFQYAVNPLKALKDYNRIARKDAMLCISVPTTTNFQYYKHKFVSIGYYNHTLPSLIRMLAVNGWDCRDAYFKKTIYEPWIHCAVYKSSVEPFDPATTSWYDLADAGLLNESMERSINRYGYLRQEDLVTMWLDKSLQEFSHH